MRIAIVLTILMMLAGMGAPLVAAEEVKEVKSVCKSSTTTICTIEFWLAYKHKKNKKEIKAALKGHSLKVLRHTVQYWKPKGGHPPTNIVIGRAISAKDARLVIELAETYNDKVDTLIVQSLNPPNYAAVATSAWDAKSEVLITPEELAALKDPSLSTEEFHALYRKLTNEANRVETFY